MECLHYFIPYWLFGRTGVAADAAGVHAESLRELGERMGAMESDLAGQKAGTEEGMLKLAQVLVMHSSIFPASASTVQLRRSGIPETGSL